MARIARVLVENIPLFSSGVDTESDIFEKHIKTGGPLGDNHFITKLETLLSQKLTKKKPGPKRNAVLVLN